MSDPAPDDPVSLVVADDYPLYVEGLTRHLEGDTRFELRAVASDGPAAVAACARHEPAVALVGYFLPELRGVALLEALTVACPGTRLVVLAGVVDPDQVHEAVAVGASGYLVKQEPGPAVLDALHRVGRGSTAFSSAAESSLVNAVRARAENATLPSPRDKEILVLLADGATAREVGERLFVSEATVKSHLARLYRKLGVTDRSAAVAHAMRRAWLS